MARGSPLVKAGGEFRHKGLGPQIMKWPRAIVVLLCLLAFCASVFPDCFAETRAATSMGLVPAAAVTQTNVPAHNPYNMRLAALEAQLQHATGPRTAVLLSRIYELRDFVDDPGEVERRIGQVAGNVQQLPLVRDEALRYLAFIDVHNHRLPAADAKLNALGFVREWRIAGPWMGPHGLDGERSPEDSCVGKPDASKITSEKDLDFIEAYGQRRQWRRMPPVGPREWIDFSNFYPHARPSTIFAATSIYSASPQTVALRFTAESAIAVFVNGSGVFVDRADGGGAGFDQHAVSVNLQTGWNTLLLKLARASAGPWRFGLRITRLEGGGLALPVSARRQADAIAGTADGGTGCGSDITPPLDLVDMANAAVEADPGSASALETLGRMEHQHARGAGLEHLEAAARRSRAAEHWLALAEACANSVCVFNAVTAALRYEPGSEPARVALAHYYFGRNQLEKARDLLREAARLEPGDFVARNGLADLYVAAGLNALALKELEQLQRDFPAPLWLRRKLAARYFDFGLMDRAQPLLSAALEQNFDGAAERSLLVQMARQQHDLRELRSAYEDLARLNPADPAPLANLAELAAGSGDFTTAGQAMRAAVAIAPEDGSLRERLANLLARSGREDEARQQLVRSVELDPHNEEARLRTRLGASAGSQADADAEYLEEAAKLFAAARREPPSATGNAVSLADVRVEHVDANGLSIVRQQQVFYIATEQGGRDYSTRSVQYAPASQELRVLHARVYKADGRVLEAEEGGETSVADAGVSMYYDVRSRVLQFPAVERGDVIELDYRISPSVDANPYGDYFGGLVVFQSNLEEKLRRYVLITPARRKFNIVEQRLAPAAVTTQGDERIYRWEARDLAPLPSEARGPALTDVAPYVHVSTFNSWADLGRWYAQLIHPQFALDEDLRKIAARLVKNARSGQERISAIHQFVLRNTHYVAMEFGIYSYKPYPVTQTYARRFGDCKDKASLMIALLRQAGIDADIALVRTRRLGDVDPRATSVALFNHAVVYVPKYDLWLDGTAEYAGLHELPLEDQGATALVVGLDGGASLRRIPVAQPGDNYTRRTVRAQLLADGHIQFTGVTYTRGEDAPGLRREYEMLERQRDAVRTALAEIFPSVHVDDVRVDGAHDFEHPVTVEFSGALDAFTGSAVVPLASSWLPRAYVQQLASQTARTQDLLLPASWTTEEELHFELPAGAVIAAIPPDTMLDTAFGSAALHYERAYREIVVRTTVQFRKLRITPSEYAAFRDFCQQAERAFHNEVKVRLRG